MNQCGVCERDLEHGYLCPGDTLALAGRLERLPKLFVELGLYLTPGVRPAGERVSSGPAGSRLPLNETVLDLRHGGIALVLESWRSDIHSVRGWGQPAVTGGLDYRVMHACRWIGMQLEWIAAAYPGAGDLAQEIRDLEGNALSIVGAKPDRGRILGQCVAVDTSGVVCGAPIRHKDGETALVCEWCHCVYATEQDWLLLFHYQPVEDAAVREAS